MRAGSRKSRRSAGPPPAARRWIPGALSGHDDQPQQKSQRGAAFTPEKKTRKGTRRQTVESKTTKIIEEKACDTHEEGNGEEQQERHKNVGNEQKKKKKNKIKGHPSGKGKTSFLPCRVGGCSHRACGCWHPAVPGPRQRVRLSIASLPWDMGRTARGARLRRALAVGFYKVFRASTRNVRHRARPVAS